MRVLRKSREAWPKQQLSLDNIACSLYNGLYYSKNVYFLFEAAVVGPLETSVCNSPPAKTVKNSNV